MVDFTIRLLELDARHTDLLERLSTLDQQVKEILSDWTQINNKDEKNEKESND
jgi:hypothetical protein